MAVTVSAKDDGQAVWPIVSTVLRMRATLYRRQSTPGRIAINVIAAAIGVFAGIALCASTFRSDGDVPGVVGGTTALTLSGLGLAWLLFPMLAGLSDDNLQPRHFQLLPLQHRALAPALFLSSLIGLTVPVTAVFSLAVIAYAAAQTPAALPLAILAWPLTVLLIVGTSRVAALLLSQLLQSRRSRELALLGFTLLFGSLYIAQFALNSAFGRVFSGEITWPLTAAKSIPFAWGLTSVDAIRTGQPVLAAAAFIGLAAAVAGILLAWRALVGRQLSGLVSSSAGASSAQRRRGDLDRRNGWRASQLGAVVTRELSLWGGDVRRRASLLGVVIFAALSGVGPIFSDSVPFSAWSGAWMVMFFGFTSATNLYGYDGASFTHLALIPQAAAADVRGRQLVWAAIISAFAVTATVVVRIFAPGDALDDIAVPIAVTIVGIGVGAGLVAFVSTRAPYPMPEATKMFSMSNRNKTSGDALAWTFAAIGIMLATTLPCQLLAALLPGAFAIIGIALAAIIGAVAWWQGGRLAIERLQSRPDLIFAQVTKPSA